MKPKTRSLRQTSWVLGLLFVGIVILINGLIWRVPLRVDLTQEKLYTLSPATKRILKNLDDLVTVRVYFSSKLPPNLIVLRDEIRDLLDEYRTYARGNLQVEWIDPLKDPQVEREARRLGIVPVQVNVLEKDKVEVVKAYMGMVFLYGDRKETIPVASDVSNLEYEITAAILKVTSGIQKTVGILLPEDLSLDRDFYEVRTELSKQYTLKTLKPGQRISGVDLLIVVGGEGFTRQDAENIDRFVQQGGNVLFLVDPVKIEEPLTARVNQSPLLDLLKHYGIQVNNDLVLDVSNEIAPFARGFVRFFVPYPYWVKITKRGFNPQLPPVRQLESLVMPWTSSLEFVGDTADTLVHFEYLARTTDKAWHSTGFFNLDPQSLRPPRPEARRSFVVAALATGRFPRYSADTTQTDTLPSYSPKTHLVVTGTSRFAQTTFVQSFPENLTFFMNLVDYLGLSEDLIAIRSKGVTDRPLKPLTEAQKNLFKFFNIYAIPAILVIVGLVVLVRRKREEKE